MAGFGRLAWYGLMMILLAACGLNESELRTPTPPNVPQPTLAEIDEGSVTPSPSAVPSATDEASATPSLTPSPSESPTDEASATPSESPSPSASPSFTPSLTFTATFTPETIPPTSVLAPTHTPPEGVAQITPSPVPIITIARPPTSAPEIASLNVDIPEANAVYIADANGNIQNLGGGGSNVAGSVFSVSPSGRLAVYGFDSLLYVDSQPVNTGLTASFGLGSGLQVLDLDWSSDNRHLALTIGSSGASPQTGIWVLDTATNTLLQVMQNDNRRAQRARWSPDGRLLLADIQTPTGDQISFLNPFQAAGTGYRLHNYANGSWSADSRSAVISGRLLGQVFVDPIFNPEPEKDEYNGYDFTTNTGLTLTHAATEVQDRRIAFLGAAGEGGPYRLWVVQPPTGRPSALSQPINGAPESWAWNDTRDALLLIMVGSEGRRLWLLRLDGSAEDITPPTGAPRIAQWR